MLSDDVLQVADDPLSPKQPLIEVIIVAVPELPEAGEQTCRRSGCNGLPLPPALAIPRQRPLDVQQIPLAGDGVPSPVPVAYSVRQPRLGGARGVFGCFFATGNTCQSPLSRRSWASSHPSTSKRSFFSLRLFGPKAVRLSIYRA